jgi:hypothetical protein
MAVGGGNFRPPAQLKNGIGGDERGRGEHHEDRAKNLTHGTFLLTGPSGDRVGPMDPPPLVMLTPIRRAVNPSGHEATLAPHRVTFVELFFDLVVVYCVTQVVTL